MLVGERSLLNAKLVAIAVVVVDVAIVAIVVKPRSVNSSPTTLSCSNCQLLAIKQPKSDYSNLKSPIATGNDSNAIRVTVVGGF